MATSEDIRIYNYDYPDFCIHNLPLPTKREYLKMVYKTIICPKIALIWRDILQEPLSLGYISWDFMIKLMVATHKHDTTQHLCIHEDKFHLFIQTSLLLCRTIHFPPFPGGDDSKIHFHAVTKAMITTAYDYFEIHIFKDLDDITERKTFQTIRKPLGFCYHDRHIIGLGLKIYWIMKEIQILPPALEEPSSGTPSLKPPYPPPPLR